MPASIDIPLAGGRAVTIDAVDALLATRGFAWKQFAPGRGFVTCDALGGRVALSREVARPRRHELVVRLNGDPLDLRRENLLPAARKLVRQRDRKRRHRGSATSDYRGVSWEAARERWRAAIVIDGRKVNLGRYRWEMDAAAAYDAAALAHYGPFARLNFPSTATA